MKYQSLAISDPGQLIFGTAPKPVTTSRGLIIGGGKVYPELNFTMPPMSINRETLSGVTSAYRTIVRDGLERMRQMHGPGVIFELETLLEMTQDPEIGVEIVKVMNEECENYFQKYGLISEIRLTPNDLREFERPPKQRSSALLDRMLELFERGAAAGGDMLSIESTGGKEVCDDALLSCNIREIVFALTVLGVRDMRMLWKKIVDIAERHNRIAGGDTACGFGNTAMVLAEKGFIPKIFAAMVRVITVVRTLVAIEEGATGPDKDCGYEGIYLKAITGTPISMEGKTAACAHLSPVGNVAAAAADLWSNESVQNIKLLGGMAPTVYYEQLEYDCRLFNEAIKEGPASALQLRNLLVNSDLLFDPQALVLAPGPVIEISKTMLQGKNYVHAAVLGSLKALDLIEEAYQSGQLKIAEAELSWIEMIRMDLSGIPDDEDLFIEQMLASVEKGKFIPEEYGL